MAEQQKKLNIKKMTESVYLFDDSGEATGYLVIGEEKACFIDTMVANFNYHDAIREITDKPILVVNTHGHPDHIYGNIFFDKAFLHPADFEEAAFFAAEPEFVAECEKRGAHMPPFEEIKEGDLIDLGGKTLKVYDLPGHTAGGILLLCPEDRILYTGDSINHHLWMQLSNCSTITEYIKALERVMFLENEADRILHGHARDFDDISLMRELLDGLKTLVEGKTEHDLPYNWFGGVAMQHPFAIDESKPFPQLESVICYQPEKI